MIAIRFFDKKSLFSCEIFQPSSIVMRSGAILCLSKKRKVACHSLPYHRIAILCLSLNIQKTIHKYFIISTSGLCSNSPHLILDDILGIHKRVLPVFNMTLTTKNILKKLLIFLIQISRFSLMLRNRMSFHFFFIQPWHLVQATIKHFPPKRLSFIPDISHKNNQTTEQIFTVTACQNSFLLTNWTQKICVFFNLKVL